MSWLITGGCGFVGTNLADALLEQGEEVAVLGQHERPRRARESGAGFAHGMGRIGR